MTNPFENALAQLSRATAVKNFNPEFLKTLESPNREIHVSIPVKMDDGSLRVFHGYRVEYNNARGPYKGGIRYHQDTDISEVKALAFWMALKCSVANIPMGGGKGGITLDPKTLSKSELEKLSRGYMRSLSDIFGPKKDVPAPDVNTTPEMMDWMNDEYGKITGDTSGAVITGKPVDKGGSEGRGPATGLGGFYVFDALRAKMGLPESCTIAIQGMGNVGGNAAEIFISHGHKLVAISDSKGGIYNESGLDYKAVEAYKKEKGTLAGFPGAKEISQGELLELPVDLLIPAALENQITEVNAGNIKAKAILELANGPTTTLADDILFGKGIHLVPDILANSGGVTVSTYEWEQNLKGERWTEADVFAKLKEAMYREANEIFDASVSYKTDIRRAAFIVALERISKAMGY
jgi:glutamate dehydrogenase/leucine dehydrogenase